MSIPRRLDLVAVALLSLGFGALLVGAQAPKPQATASAHPAGRVLLVTRHCEKDPAGDARDPGLSELGRQRAGELRALIAPQTIDAVFTSEYQRARETATIAIQGNAAQTNPVQPKAAAGGTGARTVPVKALSAGKPELLYAAIDALTPGQTALIVGHSNTVPEILAHYGAELRGPDGAPLAMLRDEDYGELFVVTLPPAGTGPASSLLDLHYGR